MSFFPIKNNPLFADTLVVHQKNFHYLFALRCTLGVFIPLVFVLIYGYEEYAGSVAYVLWLQGWPLNGVFIPPRLQQCLEFLLLLP